MRAGIDDILIITGRGKHSVEDHFDRSIELEASLDAAGKLEALEQIRRLAELADIHYVRQGEPLGLGHAVSVARKHVGDHPFAVMLGDDIMDERFRVLEQMIAAHEETGTSVIAVKRFPIEEISLYGCVDAEPAIAVQLVGHLLGVADDRRSASGTGAADPGPEMVLDVPHLVAERLEVGQRLLDGGRVVDRDPGRAAVPVGGVDQDDRHLRSCRARPCSGPASA